MKNTFWAVSLGIIGMSLSPVGQAAPDNIAKPLRVAAGEAQTSIASATGVVREVKAEGDRVKISHQAIPALSWPAMTMTFRVKDKAVLQGIAPGDKVRFELQKDENGLAITRMEKIAK